MTTYIRQPGTKLYHIVNAYLGDVFATACHQRIETKGGTVLVPHDCHICASCADAHDTLHFSFEPGECELVAAWLSRSGRWFCNLYQDITTGAYSYRATGGSGSLGLCPSHRAAIELLGPWVQGFQPDANTCPLELVFHRRPVTSAEYLREGGLAKGSPALKAWAEDHGEP